MSRLLYRAADHPIAPPGAHFAEVRENAEAYLDNPGFGGGRLFVYRVDPDRVLDVTGGPSRHVIEDLVSAAGSKNVEEDADDLFHYSGYTWVFHVLENTPIETNLRERGFQWVVFTDDFPEGATTWKYLQGPALIPYAEL